MASNRLILSALLALAALPARAGTLAMPVEGGVGSLVRIAPLTRVGGDFAPEAYSSGLSDGGALAGGGPGVAIEPLSQAPDIVLDPAAASLSSLYKEEPGAPRLGELLESREALALPSESAAKMTAPQARSEGAARMDYFLGLGSRPGKGDVVAAPKARPAEAAPRLARDGRAASGTASSVPAPRGVEEHAGRVAMFGFGALAVSQALAALDPVTLIISYLTLGVPSLIAHEIGHAKTADALGDPGPRQAGRLGWNPIRHIHWFYTVLFPILGLFSGLSLGFAKPVNVAFGRFRRPFLGMVLVGLAGPLVSFGLAAAGGLAFAALAALGSGTLALGIATQFVYFNLFFALFNLVPIPPADGGHWVVGAINAVHPMTDKQIVRLFSVLKVVGMLAMAAGYIAFHKAIIAGMMAATAAFLGAPLSWALMLGGAAVVFGLALSAARNVEPALGVKS